MSNVSKWTITVNRALTRSWLCHTVPCRELHQWMVLCADLLVTEILSLQTTTTQLNIYAAVHLQYDKCRTISYRKILLTLLRNVALFVLLYTRLDPKSTTKWKLWVLISFTELMSILSPNHQQWSAKGSYCVIQTQTQIWTCNIAYCTCLQRTPKCEHWAVTRWHEKLCITLWCSTANCRLVCLHHKSAFDLAVTFTFELWHQNLTTSSLCTVVNLV